MKTKYFAEAKSLNDLLAEGVLEPHTLYSVTISMRRGNPWFQGFLSIGFMSRESSKKLGSYCALLTGELEPIADALHDKDVRFASLEKLVTYGQVNHVADCKLSYMEPRK